MQKEISPEQLENIKEIIKDINVSNTNQGLIQDNKNYFKNGDEYYLCEMPSQAEQMEAEDFKDSYKVQIMGKFPTEKQLKKRLKEEQDIDIDALEAERQKIRDEYQTEAIKSASLLSNETEELEKQRVKIEDIEKRLMSCLMEIEENLSTSLERKVLRQYYRYIAFKVTKTRNEKGEWVPAWNTFEDFENDKSSLTYKAIANIQSLLLSIRD